MQTLTIETGTRETARGLCAVLSRFQVALREGEDGRSSVEVTLGRSDREMVDVLNAVERYVNERHAGSARITLNGHDYTLHEARPTVRERTDSFLGGFQAPRPG